MISLRPRTEEPEPHVTKCILDGEEARVIRLGGNLGASPDRDGLREVGKDEAREGRRRSKRGVPTVLFLPSPITLRTALVTGGAGFVGRTFATILSRWAIALSAWTP